MFHKRKYEKNTLLLQIITYPVRKFIEMQDNVFQFADLSKYSFKQRMIIRISDIGFYLLIKLICSTVRFEVEGWENFEKIESDGKTPIYAFWHNNIFLITYFFRNRKIVVMSSQSLDGEYTSRFLQRFGYGSVRGSSTRGGAGAVVKMIRLMREKIPVGFANDGPKGPKFEAKIGSTVLAKKTGNPLMPFNIEPNKFWTINTWDKMQIPKPFTRVLVKIAEPIYVESKINDEELENKRLELQKSLDDLVKYGENWHNP
jgi:lysophospholipid acyltransferase (LPLAT)-like uncharacterized protein